MKVAIIDYGSGNLHSALKSFERASRESGAGMKIGLTSRPEDVRKASHIVLPGVGAFGDCHAGLKAVDGMIGALEEAVLQKGRPFLGICVGMQMMASRGMEHGEHEGLGWIEGVVERISPSDPSLKIPHMGWNTLERVKDHPLLEDLQLGEDGLHAYFVHSYHFRPASRDHLILETDYGGPLTAMVGRDNLAGVQFHPEKSQKLGLALIANFLAWRP